MHEGNATSVKAGTQLRPTDTARGPRMPIRVCVIAINELQYNSNVLDLAEILARHGWAVDVFARFHDAGLHSHRGFRCRELPRGASDIATARFALAQTVGRYDIFIGMNSTGLLLCLFARALQSRGICVYYALELDAPGYTLGFSTFASMVRKAGLRRSDVIVATGPERADILHSWFPRLSRPLVMWNSPLAVPEVLNGRLRALLAQESPLWSRPDRHIVLYHGAIVHATAVDTIVRASRLWNADACLVVMGFGDHALVELIRSEARQNPNIVYLSPISVPRRTLLEYVRDASVGLVLYRYTEHGDPNLVYATPNKLFDFMASGVPVVCSNNPSMMRVEEEGWGRCVDPDDPVGVAEAVDQCIAERSARAGIAIRLFLAEYAFERGAEGLVQLIENQFPRATGAP